MSIIKVDYGTVGGGSLTHKTQEFSANQQIQIPIKNGTVCIRNSTSPYTYYCWLYASFENGVMTDIQHAENYITYSYIDNTLNFTCTFGSYGAFICDIFELE